MRPDDGEYDFVPLFVRDQDFHPAGKNDVERVCFLASADNERIAGRAPRRTQLSSWGELRVGKRGKQRDAFQDPCIQRELCWHAPQVLIKDAPPARAGRILPDHPRRVTPLLLARFSSRQVRRDRHPVSEAGKHAGAAGNRHAIQGPQELGSWTVSSRSPAVESFAVD